MAEQKNNAVATAGNIAHKLHGAAQVVRGAVTADFVAALQAVNLKPISLKDHSSNYNNIFAGKRLLFSNLLTSASAV